MVPDVLLGLGGGVDQAGVVVAVHLQLRFTEQVIGSDPSLCGGVLISYRADGKTAPHEGDLDPFFGDLFQLIPPHAGERPDRAAPSFPGGL